MTEENKIEQEKTDKNLEKKENAQLAWIIGIVALVFVIFLGIYFYNMSLKSFRFDNINWRIENTKTETLYHGAFPEFVNKNITYNIYLRNDPRTNNATVDGNLSYFMRDEIFSFSPQVDQCRGDFSLALVSLGGFMVGSIGVTNIDTKGTTDPSQFGKDSGRTFADCSIANRGVVVFQIGNESSIVQSPQSRFCYIITMKNCNDVLPVEKFIFETVRQNTNSTQN